MMILPLTFEAGVSIRASDMLEDIGNAGAGARCRDCACFYLRHNGHPLLKLFFHRPKMDDPREVSEQPVATCARDQHDHFLNALSRRKRMAEGAKAFI